MDKRMNRREFIGRLGAVAAGIAALSGSVASGQLGVSSKRWRTAVGLNGFMSSRRSYGYKMDITQVLKLIKNCGYDGVELVPWPKPYPKTPTEARELKKQYDDIGLQIMSLQGMSRGGSCGSAEKSRREKYLSDLKRQVDLLASWECEFIGVWSGGRPGPGSEEYCKRTADTWSRLTQYATERRMYVVTEPEPVMAIHTLELLEQVADSIGSPNFRLIFDPSHSTVLGGGDPFVFLKKFRGRMGHVHFTDTDGTRRGGKGTSKHLTLGDGTVDMLGTLRELKNQNYDKWIMLDLWNIPDIYRATIVGKQKLDEMLDILFPV
ncbi:MAG: sugar phosphate isomerase/epimerase family protein [Planctomycetota bacterium]